MVALAPESVAAGSRDDSPTSEPTARVNWPLLAAITIAIVVDVLAVLAGVGIWNWLSP